MICEETIHLLERIKANEIDLAIITNCSGNMTAENFRQERLLWATSNRHSVHAEERVPLALGRPTCAWRRAAIECLETVGRPVSPALFERQRGGDQRRGAVGTRGLGVSGVGPAARACACSRPPTASPNCRSCRIGLVRNPHERSSLADALAEHVISSLDNLSEAARAAE